MAININGPKLSNIASDLSIPSPKDLLNDVGNALNHVKDDFINLGGKAIGEAEMLGLQYPVKAYQSQVDGNLTRGSRLSDQDMQGLKDRGFKSVVNLCAENNIDAPRAHQLGINDLHLSIIDNTPPTEGQMKQFLDFVTKPQNQPAYVHCEAGQGRTGVAVACYRMAVDGWPPEKALAEAEKFGMAMPDQREFVQQFGQDLAAGKIAGYPVAKPPAGA